MPNPIKPPDIPKKPPAPSVRERRVKKKPARPRESAADKNNGVCRRVHGQGPNGSKFG